MERTNYQELLNNFFENMENDLNYENKRVKVFRNCFLIFGAAVAVCILAAKFLKISEAVYAAVILGIPAVIFFVLMCKRSSRRSGIVEYSKVQFYKDVFTRVVASELGLDVSCTTGTDIMSDAADGRYVTYSGMMNGLPFAVAAAAEYKMTKMTYDANTGDIISSKYEWLYSPLEVQCGLNGNVASAVTVKEHELGEKFVNNHTGFFNKIKRYLGDEDTLEKKNYISLDDKSFDFAVICDDEVQAYRTLTPAITEKIKALDSVAAVKSLEFSGSTLTASVNNNVIDLLYEPGFCTDPEYNRSTYTADKVLEDAGETIERIKAIAAMLPTEIN